MAQAQEFETTLDQSDKSVASFHAPLGMAFRPGTGNPPQAPQAGYAVEHTLNLLECGWLFVRTGDSGTVPVKIGSFGLDEPPGEGRYLTLTYADSPARR